MGLFILFSLSAIVGMIGNDFADLLSIEGLFRFDLLIQSVRLLFKLLNGDLLEIDLAFELLVSVQKVLVSLDKLFLLNSQFRKLIF